jgi:hypothetical protein
MNNVFDYYKYKKLAVFKVELVTRSDYIQPRHLERLLMLCFSILSSRFDCTKVFQTPGSTNRELMLLLPLPAALSSGSTRELVLAG